MINLKEKILNDNSVKFLKEIENSPEIYLVGGCIRDYLDDKISYDKDIIVKSDKAESFAKELADKSGGYFIVLDETNKIYRVVMPDKINYFDISAMLNDNLSDDIQRRDLTINSVVYDIKNNEIIDISSGIEDFKNGILRTYLLKNFEDDPLRMLRVFRFCAKYNFKIDENIRDFIKNNSEKINNCAKERINQELVKLFDGKYTDIALKEADKCNLLSRIFPVVEELKKIPPNTHHHLNLFDHSIETVRQTEINFENAPEEIQKILLNNDLGQASRKSFLKIGAFLHDIGKPDTWTIEEDTGRHRFIMHDEVGSVKIVPILKEMKFSKKQTEYIKNLIKFHIYPSALVSQEGVTEKAKLKFCRKMHPYTFDIILLAMSDRLSARGPAITQEMVDDNINNLKLLAKKCQEYAEEEIAPKPFLNGNEIIKITGLKQSKELGDIIKHFYNAQLEGKFTDKNSAVIYLKEFLNRQKEK